MAEWFTASNLVALLTLTALEIVLGIDNVIFVAILSGKLPEHQRGVGRQLGIGLAVFTRLLLLVFITWIMRLTRPLFAVLGKGFTGRDLILLGGGLFLIGKSTFEIHDKLESASEEPGAADAADQLARLASIVAQIVVVDIVFSLDSVITAVGISGKLEVMIPAVVIAAGFMLFAAGAISDFVERHPTMKVLALSFLILIGVVLVIEGWNPDKAHDLHIKNYAYFAMFFSFAVEMLNMRVRRKAEAPVQLRNRPTMPHAPVDETRGAGEG